MKKSSTLDKFNFVFNLFLIFVLVFIGVSYADTNDKINRPEDIRNGTFGGDEVTPGDFIFNNDTVVSNRTRINQADGLQSDGNFYVVVK
jgi:hypothetical protein